LLLTPLQYFIKPPQDIGAWLAFLVVSYIFGVLLSTITDIFFRFRPKSTRRKQNKGNIQIHDEKLKKAVFLAFNELVLDQRVPASKKTKQPIDDSEWNESYYYVCRSLVTELMPRAGVSGFREGAYRQLRMNLIGSIVIWGLAGILWGLTLLFQANNAYQINENSVFIGKEWAWILITVSIVIPPYLISNLRKLMDKHEQREVREVLTAFLAGFKTGIFDSREK